jgi:RHS repeat-associated protein
MIDRFSRRAVACALFARTSIFGISATPAQAQMKRPMPDEHGIDVISGAPYIASGKLTIGNPSQGGLAFYRVWQGNGAWFHNLQGAVTQNGSVFTVTVGTSVESFTLSGSTYSSDDGLGSTLVKNVSGSWTYRLGDGTVITFENPGTLSDIQSAIKGMLASIVSPSGFATTFTNQYQQFCEKVGTRCNTPVVTYVRLKSATTNTGYQIHLDYVHNSSSTTAEDLGLSGAWLQLSVATALNNTVDYCAPSADGCSYTESWPAVTISKTSGVPGTFTDTWVDSLSQTTTSQVASSQLTSIQSPADPAADFSLTYDGSGRVASFAQGGGTWNYTYSDVGTTRTTTVTQPLGGSKIYVSDTALRKLTSVTDEVGHTTSYSYDSYVRPTQVTKPEGNYTQLTYDGRGNVTQTTQVPKSGSGLSNIVTSANYDPTCTNPVKCNEPNYTIDAKGNQTDYTYDPTHGGVLTVTAPAPTTGAVRPQARYAYTALYAYYKNSSGTIVAAPTSVYELTSTSACQTGSSCAGTSDEVKSTIVYGSTGVANNLFPTSISKGSGDGALTATTAAAYDIFGNLTSIDGPLSGTADTYGFNYDADRQLTLAVSPDPDGAGSLLRRAIRYTYNADGNVTKIEAGTATSLTGPFTADPSGIREERTYDNLGRKITDSMASGTSTPVTNTLTQFSYDTKGRPNCSAVRMNPATFGSLPSDACTLGTAGTYGNDRISQIVYDNADEVTVLREAYGTSDQADERSLSYTNNGLLSTLRDGENNGTAYVYDGFDRLIETAYPVTTKGSGSANWSDNQQWTYDANSNVTSFRARSADTISYGYDNLDRLTSKTSSVVPSVAYTYDLLSRPLTAKFSSSGQGVTNAFDALSRLTSSSSDVGGTAHALTYQYDLAGNRTRLTWWDGFYMAYDRLVTGDLSAVRENGAISGVGVLATFGYDNLGRRTSLTRGNGTSTSYSYDAVSRLSSLTQDLPGTAFDVTFGFSYNPANQIASETRNNDSYAYNAYANTNTNTTTNGLNQVTAAGSISATWDANGNLASYGTSTATHDAENKVISAVTVGTTRSFSYDPANRLDTYNPGGSASRFIYDGNEVAAELDTSGNILHRFVRGDGADEVLVDYSGSTNSSPQFLHADVRGSIIAWSDTASNAHINLYDEYGTPVSTNQGRFQYTGQMRLGEAGIYNYKARAMLYDIGGFLEPDPIGYADGPNWYVYAHDDPVNGTDPTGLADTPPIPKKPIEPPIPVIGWRLPTPQLGDPSAEVGPVTFPRPPSVPRCGGGCDEIIITKKRSRFLIVHYVPVSAVICASFDGYRFYAPANFSLAAIVAAGRRGGQNPFATNSAIGHYGTFDFQRIRDSQGHTTFYAAYSDVSNFAAGAYEFGAGTPYVLALAKLTGFSALLSSNSGSTAQALYFTQGYQDAQFNNTRCGRQ